MENNLLYTERLVLRPISPEVYNTLFKLPENEVMAFFGFTLKEEFEKEKYRYENGLCTYNKSYLYFQLIEKKSNSIIGWCGFHTWYLDHDRAELGYGLNSDDFKRQGFMSEAIQPIIDHGFNELNLHRIEALASPKNTPSISLLKRNGFHKEGLLKQHYLIDGVYENSVIYSLIKPNSSQKKQ